jgi:hypothetical protein
MKPSQKSDENLLADLKVFRRTEDETLVEIIQHLREVRARKLFVKLGYSSLFKYCIKELKYSEASAQRRIEALRASDHLPEIEEMILDQSLNLSTISLTQKILRQESKVRPITPQEQKQAFQKVANQSQYKAEIALKTLYPESAKLSKESIRPTSALFKNKLRTVYPQKKSLKQ